MIKNIIIWLGLILFTNIAIGKKTDPLDSLITNTVLFKVTHPSSSKTSFLFGTHHAFGKSFFDSLKFATEALKSSDLLIKENLNIPGHLAEDIINKRTNSTKWSKYLNKESYRFIHNLFESSTIDINKMTPTELHTFLNRYYKERTCLSKKPTDNYYSLDDYIGTVAKENQLKLIGLETTEEQIELINSDVQGMPRKIHKKRLSRMISRINSNRTDNCSEIDWYRNMDFDFKFNQPCQNTAVLTDRNDKWMVQLKEYLKSKNCFIAVGLSHLMFECGLISHLNRLGYIITPIEVK